MCVSEFDVWVTTAAHKTALSLSLSLSLSLRVGGNFFRTLTFSDGWNPPSGERRGVQIHGRLGGIEDEIARDVIACMYRTELTKRRVMIPIERQRMTRKDKRRM